MALLRPPRLHAWLQPDGDDLLLTEHEGVHLGVAVALDDGLIVPVIRDAQTLGLTDLAAAIADLSARARGGDLHPDEVAGGTFTISNLGTYPLDHFTAIIDPPQVAILAVARAQIRPLWDGEQFAPAPIMQVTLSADHRAVDGAVAAAFLAELKGLVEEPARMLL
jgi:pyruvate dehydrogenase E2 component (dihydrolipoamide acetyltransferase)